MSNSGAGAERTGLSAVSLPSTTPVGHQLHEARVAHLYDELVAQRPPEPEPLHEAEDERGERDEEVEHGEGAPVVPNGEHLRDKYNTLYTTTDSGQFSSEGGEGVTNLKNRTSDESNIHCD